MISIIEKDEVLVSKLHKANKFWKRFFGLMPFKELKEDEGMLLMPCKDIHTCFMSFPIDVICLNKDLEIVELHSNVKPWRFRMCKNSTAFVLETASGTIKRRNIRTGLQLKVD